MNENNESDWNNTYGFPDTTTAPQYHKTYTIPSVYRESKDIKIGKNMCKFCKYFSRLESNTHFGICNDTTSTAPKSSFDETQIPVVHGEDSYSCWKGNWE